MDFFFVRSFFCGIFADRLSQGCAAIGVAEVENAKCLADLCQQEPLKVRNIQYVHVEGPDQRGIDCALLYDPARFTVRNVRLVPYIYKLPQDAHRASRGFLIVSGTMANEHVTNGMFLLCVCSIIVYRALRGSRQSSRR